MTWRAICARPYLNANAEEQITRLLTQLVGSPPRPGPRAWQTLPPPRHVNDTQCEPSSLASRGTEASYEMFLAVPARPCHVADCDTLREELDDDEYEQTKVRRCTLTASNPRFLSHTPPA
jgi:hypothetical protein